MLQGQHNVNYSYQPAIFRPGADQAIAVNAAQPMQPGPPQQVEKISYAGCIVQLVLVAQ